MPRPIKPTLPFILDRRTGKLLRNFGVATPGIVKSFNAAERTCTVQPAVHRLVPAEDDELPDNVEEFKPLFNVPVLFLQFRGMRVVPPTGALQPGDPVLLICFDRDASRWRDTGRAAEPADARLHDWQSCVAIPGLVPDTNPFPPPSDAAALGSKLDKLIGILKGWTPVTSDGGAALKAAVLAAFPAYPANAAPTPEVGNTSKSNILKLSE